MNIYQRVVLIMGAISLIIAIWTTPLVIYNQQYGYLKFERFDETSKKNIQPERHLRIIVVRTIGVVGVTFLIFFALKKKGR
jgi:hypothetical protein